MKIEQINESQIRCTLTKEDLARRNIKVSELAYGTEKARSLFSDMMQEAYERFGFVTEDYPIMVEAIPVSSDCMVLIITRSEDPEELDTRFSNFAPGVFSDEEGDEDYKDIFDDDEDDERDDEDIVSLFERIQEGGMTGIFDNEYRSQRESSGKIRDRSGKYTDDASFRVFSFPMMKDLMNLATRVDPSYSGRNTLFKNPATGRYYLILHKDQEDDRLFSRLSLLISEYGKEEHTLAASEQFFEEHDNVIIRDNALQKLAGRE